MTKLRGFACLVLVPSLLVTLASCAARQDSVALVLSLAPGMERTMQFTTEQHFTSSRFDGAADPSSTLSLTYRFRVESVSAAGVAKVESLVLDITTAKGVPGIGALADKLRRRTYVATVDASGRVLDLQADKPDALALPGVPLAPAGGTEGVPSGGDLGVLFVGLNGEKVSVGQTWTTALPHQGSGLRGTLRWTLASVGRSTTRLDYTGVLEKQRVPISNLPAGAEAILAGDCSGFVELERDTGWPRRGAMVIRADVSLGASETEAGPGAAFVSMRIVTRFDAVRR